MLKNRLIFTLLSNDGTFMLSRNFSLQRVGDLQWLKEHYDFNAIAFSIDELIVLNVERDSKNIDLFCENLLELTKNCFIPIGAGGGVNSFDVAYQLFASGADKLIVNSILYTNPELVVELVETFGGQSIVASLDYKTIDNKTQVYVENGQVNTGEVLEDAIKDVINLGVGEIYITSIDRDGTGQGYDLETLNKISANSPIPIIASGGVGRFDQLVAGVDEANVQAVSTANLFNFMADGLIEARLFMKEKGISLAEWDTSRMLDGIS